MLYVLSLKLLLIVFALAWPEKNKKINILAELAVNYCSEAIN